MAMRASVRTLGLIAAAGTLAGTLAASSASAPAQRPAAATVVARAPVDPPDNDTCLACHGDPSLVSTAGKAIGVDEVRYGQSLHGAMGMACVDCHADLKTVTDFPHADRLLAADCSSCHGPSVEAYGRGIHAAARRQEAASVAATCADCHTAHDIRASTDPRSTTYPLNLPATCSACHGNPDTIRRGHIAIGDVASLYKDSIHGRAVSRSGLLVSATCSRCHGSHDIRPATDPASRVHRSNIPEMCGECHEGIRTQYGAGVHGRALDSGSNRAPVCADCHSAHEIQRADVPGWQLDVIRECGTCHVDKMRTYRDTFHGQVTSLGFVRVATCAACHGAHSIFPSSDERSLTSPARLLATCRQCHPDATDGFTRYDPHADKHDRERNPVLYWASRFMTGLLLGVFGFFGLHALLWLPRGFADQRRLARLRAGDHGDGPLPAAGDGPGEVSS